MWQWEEDSYNGTRTCTLHYKKPPCLVRAASSCAQKRFSRGMGGAMVAGPAKQLRAIARCKGCPFK
jgi:hypothetical protein